MSCRVSWHQKLIFSLCLFFVRSKVRDKFEVISNLLDKVDEMIIGGAIAYTFQNVLHGMQVC